MRTLIDKGILQLPKISKESILDKSKTDNFAKSIAVIQVLCFTIVTFARLIQHIPIALLEISTLAFIACSAMILFFWWDEPLDVRIRMVFQIAAENEQGFIRIYPKLDRTPDEHEVAERENSRDWCMDLNENQKYKSKHVLWIGSIFNSIYVAAWNHNFPTPTEQWMWRVCSIVSWSSAVIYYLILFVPGGKRSRFVLAFLIGVPTAMTAWTVLFVEALIRAACSAGKSI